MNRNKCFGTLLVLLILIGVTSTAYATPAPHSGDWSNGWGWWTQWQSKYQLVADYGCAVVAQAKLLVSTGYASSDPAVFNPDIYAEWEAANGLVPNLTNNLNQTRWTGPSEYAAQHNMTLNYEGITWGSDTGKIWENIYAGKATIVQLNNGSHYVYVNNQASIDSGRLLIFESWNDWEGAYIPGTRDLNASAVTALYTYSVPSTPRPKLVFDVNATLDGNARGDAGGLGTFDLYFDGVLEGTCLTDYYYYEDAASHSSYQIKNIEAMKGYAYVGPKEYSGSLGGDTVVISLPFETLTYQNLNVNVILDGVELDSAEGIAVFDVYTNNEPAALGVSGYSASLGKYTAYEIRNIVTNPNYTFLGGTLSGTMGSEDVTVTLRFSMNVEPTVDWQQTPVLPGNISPDQCEIQYKHTYKAVGPNAPDADWEQVGDGWVTYENVGGVYESDFPLETSNTRVYVSSYYYHYCGANTNDVNFAYTDLYNTYHNVGDVNKYYVTNQHADYDDARYTFYWINWVSGQWADGPAYCSSGKPNIYYRRYQYQDRAKIMNYNWFKTTDWMDALDASADSVCYRFRLKDSQAPMITSVELTAVTPNGYALRCTATDDSKISNIAFTTSVGDNAAKTQEITPELRDGSYTAEVQIRISDFGSLRDACYATRIAVTDTYGNTAEYGKGPVSVIVPSVFHSGKKLQLPLNTRVIEAAAFEGDIRIGEVVLPDDVERIESKAFADCGRLSLIYIPDSVSSIAADAFEDSANVVMVCSIHSAACDFARENGIPFITAES